MVQTCCGLININNFIQKLNRALDSSEGAIMIGDPVYKIPRKEIFPGFWESKKREGIIKYPLYQNRLRGILAVFGVESEKKIGYCFIEKGSFDLESGNPGQYENMKLRIKPQIELRRGVLPACCIKLSIKTQDGIDFDPERKDHSYHLGGLFSKRTDLSEILPNNWF